MNFFKKFIKNTCKSLESQIFTKNKYLSLYLTKKDNIEIAFNHLILQLIYHVWVCQLARPTSKVHGRCEIKDRPDDIRDRTDVVVVHIP